MLGVDETVIGRVGLVEHWEPLSVLLPGELAAIDDDAAESRSVTAHEFC